jgi:hypothetical protein
LVSFVVAFQSVERQSRLLLSVFALACSLVHQKGKLNILRQVFINHFLKKKHDTTLQEKFKNNTWRVSDLVACVCTGAASLSQHPLRSYSQQAHSSFCCRHTGLPLCAVGNSARLSRGLHDHAGGGFQNAAEDNGK